MLQCVDVYPLICARLSENTPQKHLMNEDWKTATNRVIAKTLIGNLESLLKGKAYHLECSDRTTRHKKIVIEYGHETK